MGGNAAEAHPCGFKWVTEAKVHNKGKLIVVDQCFTRSAAVADLHVPIRSGTDIAWLGSLINYLLADDKIQHEFMKAYTNASLDSQTRSNRGQIIAVAVVTQRIRPLNVDGEIIYTVGVPIHWGFTGQTKKGYAANMLTPYVCDANIETPE